MDKLKLTAEESKILRLQLPAVRALIDKGLITSAGILTASGQRWVDEDYPALLRAARQKGGNAGGEARAESLTRTERVKIAKRASKASIKVRKAAAREKEK